MPCVSVCLSALNIIEIRRIDDGCVLFSSETIPRSLYVPWCISKTRYHILEGLSYMSDKMHTTLFDPMRGLYKLQDVTLEPCHTSPRARTSTVFDKCQTLPPRSTCFSHARQHYQVCAVGHIISRSSSSFSSTNPQLRQQFPKPEDEKRMAFRLSEISRALVYELKLAVLNMLDRQIHLCCSSCTTLDFPIRIR